MSPQPRTTTKKAATGLVYVGPVGMESPTFGPLVPGESYQCEDSALAEYLVSTHPEYWRRPGTQPPPAEKE